MPKALLRDARDVPFLHRAVRLLAGGGCDSVTVVLGASAEDARALVDAGSVPAPVHIVVTEDWAEGMGASLRAGLRAVAAGDAGDAESVLVSLVDLPDLDVAVLHRVLRAGRAAGPAALVRATYLGRPGHPVLIGRDHWAAVAATAGGDSGARKYLRAHGVVACECGDLATGRDVDRPEDLPPPRPDSP